MPDPLGENFAGRILQSRNFIEIIMVQLLIEWLEDGFYLGEITNPAGIWIDFTLDIDRNAKRVAMQTPAFVTVRDVRESMGGLEDKLFEQFHCVSLCWWRAAGRALISGDITS